jgi:hypothetical protein
MFNREQLLVLTQTLPPAWGLVAINGQKAPYQPNWQHTPLTPAQMATEIRQNPHCQAVGVLCGTPSGGLLFVDHDGASCDALIESLSGLPLHQALPRTVSVTSGRPGRYQNIYQVPKSDWDVIATHKIKTGKLGDDSKAEQIEFRWDGGQSVVVGAHPLTGCYQWMNAPADCAIAAAPIWMIQQMLKAFPARTPPPVQPIAASGDVPLAVCLGRGDRALLQHGVPAGQRNDAGAKLARNLLGTANYLQGIGQRFAGEPQALFEQFCDRCSPPINAKEAEQIWRSATKESNLMPSLSPDKLATCIQAWKQRQQSKVQSVKPNAPDRNPRLSASNSITTLSKQMQKLLLQNLSDSILQAEKISLRSQTTLSEREFSDLWQSVQTEMAEDEGRIHRESEIEQLLEFGRRDLRLDEILPDPIALLLARQAALLGSTEAAMLLTLLPTVASLTRVGTRLELIKATGFYALPILYTGICGESGTAKSPTQKTILKPLFGLQSESDQAYSLALEDWEQVKANPENGQKPPKPLCREYYTVDVTREAIAQIQSQQSGRGFLGWMDELSGLIGGQNQYRHGRGTDKEALLSGRDGTPLKVNRAGGTRISTQTSAYSITGGVQPDTLQALMGDLQDPSGQWARFLFTCLPIQAMAYPLPSDDDIAAAIETLLDAAYRQVDGFAPRTYTFTSEALLASKAWFLKLEHQRLGESKQALRSVYAKAKGNTGEIALLLHLLQAALLQAEPADQIPLATLESAIQVMKHCLGQVQLIHSWGEQMTGELSPTLVKIIELSDRMGFIRARDVKSAVRPLRQATPDKIRKLFVELVSIGKGVIEGEGIRMRFRATPSAPSSRLTNADSVSTAQRPSLQAIPGFVDNADPCFDRASRPDRLASGSDGASRDGRH